MAVGEKKFNSEEDWLNGVLRTAGSISVSQTILIDEIVLRQAASTIGAPYRHVLAALEIVGIESAYTDKILPIPSEKPGTRSHK